MNAALQCLFHCYTFVSNIIIFKNNKNMITKSILDLCQNIINNTTNQVKFLIYKSYKF